MGGLGATHYGSVSYTKGDGSAATTLGGGVKMIASPNVGLKLGIQWTPTCIKSDAVGWWCDPWWGCYVVGNTQYSHQFDLNAGISFRF